MIERNRDAYLLSPATLLDRTLGRRVHLRRTSRATGAVREQEAIVRSGAAGAVVLQTADGFEALRCTGLPETIVYDGVPQGLAARPTLSVRARSAGAVTATVTLSYLATGLDWQANYVATLSPDGTRLGLFAWLTLANGDETGFANADTQAVAGHLNRSYTPRQPSEGGPLNLRCWPQGTTSDIPLQEPEQAEDVEVSGGRMGFAAIMAPSAAPAAAPAGDGGATGGIGRPQALPHPRAGHRRRAQPEAGRLAAARRRAGEPRLSPASFPDRFGGGRARAARPRHPQPHDRRARPAASRRAADALSEGGPRPILLGQGIVTDHAVGEDVEIGLGPAPGVQTRLTVTARTKAAASTSSSSPTTAPSRSASKPRSRPAPGPSRRRRVLPAATACLCGR